MRGCHHLSSVMQPDRPTPPGSEGGEVMASVDDAGPEQRLVIADISADDEWVAMATAHAASLSAWR